MTPALATVGAYLLLILVPFGISAARAAIRHRSVPDAPHAWARRVRTAVLADGEWTDGEAVVWRGLDGWWHLEEPQLGALVVPPGDAEGELLALYWRRASVAAREAQQGRGGVA